MKKSSGFVIVKPYLKSRTLWASLATIVTGLGLYFTGDGSVEEALIAVIGGIFAILRLDTSTKLK